jgi:hypothetical protein
MSRNGSGTYTKVNTFVAGNSITAAGHNQNWDDIASEITNSVAADGQTSMTGPLKAASGTAAAPSHTFGADVDTGAYRSASNEYSIAAGGSQIAAVNSSGIDVKTGDLNLATGTVKIAGVAAFPVPTAQIAADAVTYAKIQNVAASRLLGNPTGGATDASEISLGAGLEFSSTTIKAVSVVPTIQRFLSGSGTYTTPADVKWIRIRLVGGGGGGGGGNNSSGASSGGTSTFSGGSLSAAGGSGGSAVTGAAAGGAASGGNVANIPGGSAGSSHSASNGAGGHGGCSVFGGGGGGSAGSTAAASGATNSGGGGGGGGGGATTSVAGGGGAGGYVEHIISAPAASYSYAVGASGAGQSGTSAGNGGAGAAGIVIVEEHY